jgi:mannose-6-phosphate isomerase
MPALKLPTIRVEKPWGRHRLWPGFDDPAPDAPAIGEIWFDTPGEDPDLLVKYLFTSERLSIQVHPDDREAQARGYARGKDEAWVILDAEPDARIALGTLRPIGPDELRAAAIDGSIETLMDWKPVKAGDTIYSPAKTVHAIGAGITLIEIQQNVDLTYRLYDYGRPRELHLDDGIAVSDARPFTVPPVPPMDAAGRVLLAKSDMFVFERWHWSGERRLTLRADGWLVPVSGEGRAGGLAFRAGDCIRLRGAETLSLSPGSDMLFASPRPFQLG